MIYVASPFTHDDPVVMTKRYLAALAYTCELLRESRCVFSPIVYTHDMFIQYNLPAHYHFWKEHNNGMLRRAERMHVLKLDGWMESKGVNYEIDIATYISIPVEFIDWPE